MLDKRMWGWLFALPLVSTLAICGSQIPLARAAEQEPAAAVTCTVITICPTITPTSPVQAWQTHQHDVQRGETLSGIARKYGISLQELLDWNADIADPDRIVPGQKIVIKAPAAETPVRAQEAQTLGASATRTILALLAAFLVLLVLLGLFRRRT